MNTPTKSKENQEYLDTLQYQQLSEQEYAKYLTNLTTLLSPTVVPMTPFTSTEILFPTSPEATSLSSFLDVIDLNKQISPWHYIYLISLEALLPLKGPNSFIRPPLESIQLSNRIFQEYLTRHGIGDIFATLALAYHLTLRFDHSFEHILIGDKVADKLLVLIQGDFLWTKKEVSFLFLFILFYFLLFYF